MVAFPGNILYPDPGSPAGAGWRKCTGPIHLYTLLRMKTEQTRYRETLLVIVLGFSILFLITDRIWMLYVALGTGITGMLSMRLNGWIHHGWLFLGEKMGWVMSKVLLGALYIVILLPVSALARVSRKEIMNLKSPEKSGFHKRNHLYGPDDLENMW